MSNIAQLSAITHQERKTYIEALRKYVGHDLQMVDLQRELLQEHVRVLDEMYGLCPDDGQAFAVGGQQGKKPNIS